MQTLEFRAMNTAIILAAASSGGAGAGLQAARALIDDAERRYSRFLPDSEISLLNRSTGDWHVVSEDLMDMLVRAAALYQETGGLFDPAILPDLKRSGYDKSMDEIRAHGASSSIAARPNTRHTFSDMQLDPDRRRVRMPAGMQIDLGGIAKGWIVDQAATLLAGYSPACAVSAGGDIVFKGDSPDGLGWQVRVEDPRDPTATVITLSLGPGAVATSSVVKRAWTQDGVARHHLIDPRTGEPATTDWLSVTALAPEIAAAEVYAKAMLIGGEGEASALVSKRPENTYFIVKADGTLMTLPAIQEESNEYDYAAAH